MKKLILAALATALLPASALAQDATIGGAFVGGQIGWGKRSVDLDFGLPGVQDFERNRDGIDYGVFAGYDYGVGNNVIVGVEAGIGFGGKTLRGTPVAGLTAEIDPKWNYDVSARAGFLATPNLLVYGRLGYGAERTRVSTVSTIEGVASASDKGWSDGILYGGGLEYGLNEAASIRTEYRHRDMDSGYAADQVLAGLAFRF
ncbi:MAG: porin family protein [Sphingomonadaceae bacterium]|nr:porin family protein [Sphingomonadaceae bacterium]